MGTTTRSRFGAGSGTVAAVILAATVAAPGVAAGEIRISMDRGRVTLIATDAPLADVLAEWARVGGTLFAGAEAIGGELITLHLVEAGGRRRCTSSCGPRPGMSPRRAARAGRAFRSTTASPSWRHAARRYRSEPRPRPAVAS